MKYFLGPMSKNIVDAVIDYSKLYSTSFTFIPSRRQIDKNSGYVNGWRTSTFACYVKEHSLGKIEIERDHGGPGQGDFDDDGLESFMEDLKYFDIIHVDPWKKYPLYEDGLEWTVKFLNICHSINPHMEYEVGTEEAIRPFSAKRLEIFLEDLKRLLSDKIFQKIRYVVIQCGTQLKEKENIGVFNTEKLKYMLDICKKYNKIAKEHNGDWVSQDVINKKQECGLTCINIAPELGEIETKIILKYVKNNIEDFNTFYNICYQSGRWKKWVTEDFDPQVNKEKLILICGHYVFSNPEFIQLLTKYKNYDLDKKIRQSIFNKLHTLTGVFTERQKCLMCDSGNFDIYFNHDYETSLSFQFSSKNDLGYIVPFNILSCKNCQTVQTKYIANVNILYGKNHVDSFGSTKQNMIQSFASFVGYNREISGILEAGTPTADLANAILQTNNVPYTIIEPDFIGVSNNINVKKSFIEDVNLKEFNGNTLVLSHIFEHLYNPRYVLEKIKDSNLNYIYFNHPNYEYYCKNNVYNILNIEHISYFETQFLIDLLQKYGFELKRKQDYEQHSIFLEFIRTNCSLNKELKNITAISDTKDYFYNMVRKINILNSILSKSTHKTYLWPASAHNITLLNMGLQYPLLEGFLDNSPNKIGKSLSGYNIPCYNFQEIINSDDPSTMIIIGCSGNYIKELNLNNKKVKILYLEQL